ncbi:NUC189-domain-containing protein [Myriangium duriaei CBS 260.36]|uniref:NUC189-domain-containing protein n=1 Tax=Myriangium duriaei CBS 260.36 TaxID=1168546 RepID=A0A9P4MP28_9PEZI|nr:NUC189-domain-containing protein [Myriangium duriaei CBS 260.36]
MSTTKRTRQRQPEQAAVASLPPAKRAKITKAAQQTSSGLGFLTDERRRSGRTIQAKTTNGIDGSRAHKVDESQAAISNQAALDDDAEEDDDGGSEISSSSEEPSSSSEDDVEGATDVPMTNGDLDHVEDDGIENGAMDISEDQGALVATGRPKTNGIVEDEAERDENAAPSFGEMLQTVHPDIIDVTASLDDQDFRSKSLIPTEGSKVLQAPSATSLGTVLTQALRTNDKELLESCLQTKDTATIKSTIQRLQSRLVATLMQNLAERLHKRPGRAGPLMVWVQWSLVAHGGYLAGQPAVVKKLRALRQVVRERAGSLQPLITLKGKLDLLSAQVELRRSIRAQHADADDSDEEDDVVYVEGDDASSSSEEEDDDDMKLIKHKPHNAGKAGRKSLESQPEIGEDMDGDVPIINGIDEDAEMESLADEEDGEDQEGAGLIDDEADESEGEESMSSEVEESDSAEDADAGDNDDDSSSGEDVPATRQTRSSRPTRRAALIRKR